MGGQRGALNARSLEHAPLGPSRSGNGAAGPVCAQSSRNSRAARARAHVKTRYDDGDGTGANDCFSDGTQSSWKDVTVKSSLSI